MSRSGDEDNGDERDEGSPLSPTDREESDRYGALLGGMDDDDDGSESVDSLRSSDDDDDDNYSLEIMRSTSEVWSGVISAVGERLKGDTGLQLEQAFWDASYDLQPTGEICVADVLQVIFLFLQADLRVLMSVGSVCRSWRERATYLPQWFGISPVVKRRPPLHVMDLLPIDSEFVWPPPTAVLLDFERDRKGNCGELKETILGTSRAVFSSITTRTENENDQPPETLLPLNACRTPVDRRQLQEQLAKLPVKKVESRYGFFWESVRRYFLARIARKNKQRERRKLSRDYGCGIALHFIYTFFAIGAVLGIAFLLGYGNRTKGITTQAKLAATEFFTALFVWIVSGIVLGLCFPRCFRGTKVKSSWLEVAFLALVPCIVFVTLPSGLVMSLLEREVAVFEEISETPCFDASSAVLEGMNSTIGPPPFYVKFPPGSMSKWELNRSTTHSLPNRFFFPGKFSDLHFVRLEFRPAGRRKNETQQIGVVLPPFFNLTANRSFWSMLKEESDREENRNKTYYFRTTRFQDLDPMPWYLYPEAPWPEIPAYWFQEGLPVMGLFPTEEKDMPQTRARGYKDAIVTLLIVCACIAFLGTLALALPRRRMECCAVWWAFLIVLCLNPIVSLVFGAVCGWGTHSFCPMTPAAGKGLFGVSVSIIAVIVYFIVRKK